MPSMILRHHLSSSLRRSPIAVLRLLAVSIASAVMAVFSPVAFAQAKPTFGIFAYSVFPGSTDPCAIQYVAAELPNARYGNPKNGYTLVTTASGRAEADAAIQRFSMFFDDEPDGVLKLGRTERDIQR